MPFVPLEFGEAIADKTALAWLQGNFPTSFGSQWIPRSRKYSPHLGPSSPLCSQ